MNDAYVISVDGLRTLDDLGGMSDKIELNAVRAINKVAERARTGAARRIRQEVNLPAAYLNRPDRLGLTQKATRGNLEARITGRHRPTSLARYATSGRLGGAPGARVSVKPGFATFLPKAFFVNLHSGNTDSKGNLGLAIRLPEGQRPNRAYRPTKLSRGAWLLYGPSIDQVFDDVALDMAPDVADQLETEFNRLMGVGLK